VGHNRCLFEIVAHAAAQYAGQVANCHLNWRRGGE
jgi:hypothetical protein